MTGAVDTAGRAPRRRLPRPGRRVVAAAAVLVLVAGIAVAVTDPFAGGSPAASGGIDNGAATALMTIRRQSLSSQTEVDGTLGYAGSSTLSVPSGTAPTALRQAEEARATAAQNLGTAQSALSADRRTLAQAQAQLTADLLKAQVDCAGSNAAESAGTGASSGAGGGGGSSSPCAAAAQALTTDRTALAEASQKVAADQGQTAAAQASLNGAGQNLAAAQSSAVVYDVGATFTMLPRAGAVIRRGQPLFGIDGEPTLLLYGPVAAWRAFRPGMSPGRDVAQLKRNLEALGFGRGLDGDAYTAATVQAVEALQSAHGLTPNGMLPLGAVMFAAGPVRVTSVTPSLGQAVQAGPVLTVSSTRHEVAIQLDAAQQSQIKVGDRVDVTLPDNSTSPGVVSDVGKVATVPSSSDQGNDGSSTPTIEVDVRLLHQAAAGSLDQAPVSVSITTASVRDVLVVPVNALLALAGGGYAVEIAGAGGVRHLVPVRLGLFDDADGQVQVSGAGLRAGQRVVVPAE